MTKTVRVHFSIRSLDHIIQVWGSENEDTNINITIKMVLWRKLDHKNGMDFSGKKQDDPMSQKVLIKVIYSEVRLFRGDLLIKKEIQVGIS